VNVSLDRSPMTELPSFEPGPLSSYVHFYLAIRSQLERVWQSIVAIEASLREELGPFATSAALARPRGGIRTLAVGGDGTITYDLGVAAPDDAAAHFVMIDSEMRRLPPGEVALLRLA